MKNLILFLLLLLNSISAKTQTIEETDKMFREAVQLNKNELVVKYGDEIINYIKKNDQLIDSNIILYFIYTASAYSSLGDYASAKKINEQSLYFIEKKYGKLNASYALSLNNLALNYSDLGDYAKSKEHNEECLKIYESLYGKEHLFYPICLGNIALNYSNLGDATKSKELNENCIKIFEKLFGRENAYYALSLNNLASNYSDLGEYSKSKELNKECLEIYEKLLGTENTSYALSLNNLALNYSDLGDYSKSKVLHKQCLKIYEKLYGKEHSEYALILNNLAMDYTDLGDYSKSKELNEECLKIFEKVFGEEHPKYLVSLSNLASNYSDLGDYSKSKELNEKCLKTREKLFGKEHPDYAISLNNLAANYSDLEDYSKSLEINEECLKVYELLFGKEHPNYCSSLNNLAVDYSNLEDYSKSLSLNKQCLIIREKVFGKDHPNYALSLHNLASNYSDLGDYTKAKNLHEDCLKIYEKLYGKEHSEYASGINNLASDYSDLGDYTKAIELNLQCLKIYENLYGKVNSNYALSLSNLAFDYSELGDYINSMELNKQCLIIREEVFGKDHPDYLISLNNVASNYSDLEDYSRAKKLYLECLKIYDRKYGKNHLFYAISLSNLASTYSDLGDYSKAKELHEQSINIRGEIYGKTHPDYASNLSLLSLDFYNLRDFSNSHNYFSSSFKIDWGNYINNKFGLNKNLQFRTKNKLENSFQYLTSLSLKIGAGIDKLNYYWINLNGIIGSDQNQLADNILSSTDTSLINSFTEYKACKLQLGKWNEMTIQSRNEKGINTEELENSIEKLESELSQKSKSFANATRDFELRDVQSSLSKDEVLVDIIRIQGYEFKTNLWTDSVKYLIFFTNASNDTVPQYIVINEGAELEDELYSEYSKNTKGMNNEIKEIDLASYKHFWKPIADKIADYKTVYISLGGIYNYINLNALYNPNTGKYLLEEKDIHIVNSARDFVLSKEQEKKIYTTNTASLFGFPDFNGNTNVSSDSMDFFASTRDLNAFWLDSLTRGGLKANPLPATKLEVENISLTLKSKGWQVNSFLADNASEMNIKKQESPRILHIATHGYFFPDVPLEKDNNRFLGMDRQQVMQDPMLRSGLLFTGANRTLKGEESKGENGLLSAAEASLLDLRETELVVLSACETGKGEVKNSEGVYGLRKAFSDAGAKNIIMSLWKVDDKVTQEFMSRFYEIWLNDKTTIREAFNKTQLEIKAKYPEPYYWGAFILVGE